MTFTGENLLLTNQDPVWYNKYKVINDITTTLVLVHTMC